MQQSWRHVLTAFVFFVVVGINASTPTKADTVYTYTGNNYTTVAFPNFPGVAYATSMHLSGSFTVAGPLLNVNGDIAAQVLSFSFFDGNQKTITSADPITP